MTALLRNMALLPVIVGWLGVAMLLPAGVAFSTGDAPSGRAFLYSAILVVVTAVFLGVASGAPGARRTRARRMLDDPLAVVILSYAVLPPLMAVPLTEAVADLELSRAWFEMVSSFTTTGASVFDSPRRVPDAVHLWRATVGWLGGAFVLVVAAALIAPVARGDFLAHSDMKRREDAARDAARLSPMRQDPASASHVRLGHEVRVVLPVYVAVTGGLWIALVVAGNPALLAVIQAMSTVSTSGITMARGPGPAGFWAEALILAGLVLALSRRGLPGARAPHDAPKVWRDPELRLAAVLVLLVSGVLLLRHWLGAHGVGEGGNLRAAVQTLWGGLFTAVSFLSTTGFVSQDWGVARAWSGVSPPGLILLGLAMTGGGVATTAGGLKLLRLHALVLQGRRELDRVVYPSSVGGDGPQRRALRRDGAMAAWLILMLFLFSTVAIVSALTLLGLRFEHALVYAIAAITTTGPLTEVAADVPLSWAGLGAGARAVLGLAMVLGRLEILLVLTLFMGQARR